MSPDPEARWPLTYTEPGYYPGPSPAPAPSPTPNVAPYLPPGTPAPYTVPGAPPSGPKPPMSTGLRIAFLSIILGTAIPLTAIAASIASLPGMALSWVGIVMVAFIAFGRPGAR